ncbi:MAG: ABC transporter permease subunit [Ignavibacteriales bacterium]|nr:ABC transporter permease subunit [Ignavibacteriales bacterium]
MRNIYQITIFTLREALARKIFIIFSIVSTLVLIGFAIGFAMFDLQSFMNIRIGKGNEQQLLSQVVGMVRSVIIGPLFGGGLFLSIFSTAGIISALFEKGNIDLFLSKPISRAQLLLGKYFGGILIVFLNIAYVIIGIWFLVGLKFSNWDPAFLYSILTITFAFAVIYSLIIFAAVLTKSSVLSMVSSYVIFFILSPLLMGREFFFEITHSTFLKSVLDFMYYIIPLTSPLGTISTFLAINGTINSYEPIIISFVQLILILAASITVFNKKDY